MNQQTTPHDYAIKMQDSTGRHFDLYINGDSVNEMAQGMPEWQAREEVESNAFANAIARGDIGADAWVCARVAA